MPDENVYLAALATSGSTKYPSSTVNVPVLIVPTFVSVCLKSEQNIDGQINRNGNHRYFPSIFNFSFVKLRAP